MNHTDAALVQSALNIMHLAHSGQTDRSGEPYTGHTFRVGMLAYQITRHIHTMCIGFLHDVLEDCPGWTESRLLDAGIHKDVVESINTLTRRSSQRYDVYVNEIAIAGRLGAQHVVPVKIADLEDNIGRPGATPELYERYLKALHRLRGL